VCDCHTEIKDYLTWVANDFFSLRQSSATNYCLSVKLNYIYIPENTVVKLLVTNKRNFSRFHLLVWCTVFLQLCRTSVTESAYDVPPTTTLDRMGRCLYIHWSTPSYSLDRYKPAAATENAVKNDGPNRRDGKCIRLANGSIFHFPVLKCFVACN